MSGITEIIKKFQYALPAVRQWVVELLKKSRPEAVAVSSLGFSRLAQYFPGELLERVQVVTVSRIPFPPLGNLGLPELGAIEDIPMNGITYTDMFFIRELHGTESLHFHELVHAVQWDRLGIDNFLMTYGIGLVQFGYERSPLEQMAYKLQDSFDRGSVPPDLIESITKQTDSIWEGISRLVP